VAIEDKKKALKEDVVEDIPEDASEPEIESAEDIQELVAEGGVPRINLTEELRKIEAEKGGEWEPKTRLGRLVKSGKITSMHQALASGLPLREPEIVDILLPDLSDEVTSVNMVQRMTDSGRRVRFSIQTVVGNKDGYVGIGMAKGREVGPSIRRAIDAAKLNIIEIRRGCGSWECGCGTPHTVPFEVTGKCASAEITVRPAPRGVGLAVGDIARKVFGLAGIKDAWGLSRGQTRTTVNAAQASFNALVQVSQMRISQRQSTRIKVTEGNTVGPIHTHTPEPKPEAPAEAAAVEGGGAR
jgi:small subunit ribosomal protein S5